MKNPLAVVVALILVALGVLLYVNGDSWNRWRQWAQLPAQQATVSDQTVAVEGTSQAAPPEQQTAAADVAATAPASDAGVASGQAQAPASQSDAPAAGTEASTSPSFTADGQPAAQAGPQTGSTETADTGPAPGAGLQAGPTETSNQGETGQADADKPSFDIVRVEEDRTAVIAGRAAPKATVTVRLDSAPLGETEANDRGEWVLVVDKPLAPGSHTLSVVAAEPGKPAVNSDQVVALALSDRAEERPLIVATEPDAPAKVLAAPEAASPAISPSGGHDLALGTVDYNSSGEMIFAGKASSGAKVRLYIDNRHVADAHADSDGDWLLEHKARIASGTHQLRLDQLTAEGKVVKRIELPFERASEAQISQLLGERTDEVKNGATGASKPAPRVVRTQPPSPVPPSTSAPAQILPQQEARSGPSIQEGGAVGVDGRTAKSSDRLSDTGRQTGQTAADPDTRTGQTASIQPAQPQVATPVRPAPELTEQVDTGPDDTSARMVPTDEPAPSVSGTVPAAPSPESQPAAAAAPAAETSEGSGRVVIQPGNNLWRIARVIYGQGVQYSVIYQANKEQIRNPDLIYPGQIFATPGVTPPETIPPGRRRPMEETPID